MLVTAALVFLPSLHKMLTGDAGQRVHGNSVLFSQYSGGLGPPHLSWAGQQGAPSIGLTRVSQEGASWREARVGALAASPGAEGTNALME